MAFHFRHCVAVVAASGFLCVDGARAEDEVETRGDESNVQEEVVVTGSNIRGLPREYVASPVFSYDAKDMERSGLGSLAEYIQTIPQNFIGDLSEAATTGVGFGTGLEGAVAENQFDGFSAFSLRGLGSDATLTLLNGRRLPNAGMTETPTVSFIPTMLIERIDIVPDGASATYGADAVGGVVNLVTRRHFEGLELRARASTATEVTRNEYQFSAGAGHAWSGGNVYGVAAWQDRAPLVGDDVRVGRDTYRIAITPEERVRSFFGGASQQFGEVKLSVDGSWFDSDRRSFQLTLPANDRRFFSDSNGHSLYSTLEWQASEATSFDVTLDYHENETYNETRRRGTLQLARHHANRLLAAQARGQTELFALPGGAAQAAGGLQYRRETLRTDASAFFQFGGGETEVSSVFAEAFFPLIGVAQDVPLVRSLVVSAAARHEDFGSPIGSKLAPKFGVRWSLTEEWTVRSTFSRSFLVPKLRDRVGIAEQVSFFAQADAFSNPAEQDPRLPAGTSLVLFRAGSNPALTPQDAKTFTLGVDFAPSAIEGLDVSVGYYRTRLTDRVASPRPDDILLRSSLQSFANRNPTAEELASVLNNPVVSRRFAVGLPFIGGGDLVMFPSAAAIPADLVQSVQVIADSRSQNYATELTEGLDLESHFRRALFGGEALFRLRGQYILTLERRTTPDAPAESRLNTIFNPADLTFSGTIGWQRGPLSIGSIVYFSDGYTDTRAGQNERRIGSYTTASVSLGWQFRAASASLVVANVFDQEPPQIAGEVLTFSPINSPANPRTVALLLTRQF